jgi:hypothetical protein
MDLAENLQELASGKEIEWDYIELYVRDGAISREEALPYLKQCLEKVIPEYRKMSKYNHYWEERLKDAEDALKAIDEGNPVKYRGHKL